MPFQTEGDVKVCFEHTVPPATLIDTKEIPADTPELFLAYIQRDVNCLEDNTLGVRQQSLLKLERLLVQQVDELATDVVDATLDAILKPLLKRLRDKSEKCRELSVRILTSLANNCSSLSATLGYVFPVMVSRFACEAMPSTSSPCRNTKTLGSHRLVCPRPSVQVGRCIQHARRRDARQTGHNRHSQHRNNSNARAIPISNVSGKHGLDTVQGHGVWACTQ